MISKKEFFKIKVVMVLGYNGLNFHGMQKNQGVVTIEETIEKALFESGLIAEHNYKDLKKIQWQRAARTDKGVHAVANFVNCKLQISSKFIDEDGQTEAPEAQDGEKGVSKGTDKGKVDWKKVINVINSNLPNDIRIHYIKKITKSFDVKASARSRIYEYMAPFSIFVKDSTNMTPEIEEKSLARIKGLCEKFLGTHNFHNYTKSMKATDPKANRYIMKMECGLVDQQERGKYIKFIIQGQSFIYHQIRKMIGMMIQIIHQDLPDQFLSNSFYNNAIQIWLAPPQGLLLDRVTFEGYNKKKDIPEPLEFTEEENKVLQEFKQNVIYPSILEAEDKDKAFTSWLAKAKEVPFGSKLDIEESSEDEMEEEDNPKKGKGKGKGKNEGSDDD